MTIQESLPLRWTCWVGLCLSLGRALFALYEVIQQFWVASVRPYQTDPHGSSAVLSWISLVVSLLMFCFFASLLRKHITRRSNG